MSEDVKSPKKNSPNAERLKKESLERLKNSYYQALADSDTQQTKKLEIILKRLGVTKLKG